MTVMTTITIITKTDIDEIQKNPIWVVISEVIELHALIQFNKLHNQQTIL